MSITGDENLQFRLGPGTCLAELDASSLTAITRAAVRHSYKKGQIICLEGDPCPGLIIIESGWLTGLKISPQGREQEIRLVGPGEMINEISVMAGDTNQITVKCLEDSVVWVIERTAFLTLMNDHPLLTRIMNRNLAKVVIDLINLVEDLSLRNVEGRLAQLLLNHAREGSIRRQNWSTQEELAARIGTTSVVISRLLNEMQCKGAIRMDRRQILVLDQQKLEMVVFQSHK